MTQKIGYFNDTKGVFRLAFIYVAITLTLVILLNAHTHSSSIRVIFSIIAPIPLITSSYVLIKEYALVVYDKSKSNDDQIQVVHLLLTASIWVSSWAAVFMIVWCWDQTSWTDLYQVNVFEVYVRFWSTSLLIAPGIGFARHVPETVWAHVVSALMGWLSFTVLSLIVATSIDAVFASIPSEAKEFIDNPSPSRTAKSRLPSYRTNTQDNTVIMHAKDFIL